jgi:predicted nucleotide-binding protein
MWAGVALLHPHSFERAVMATNRTKAEPASSTTRPELTTDVASARAKIAERIALGRALLPELRVVHVRPPEGDDVTTKFRKWHEYNVKLIEQLFTTDRFSHEYSNTGPYQMHVRPPTAQEISADLVKRTTRAIANLEQVDEALELYAPKDAQTDVDRMAPSLDTSRIFIVHGRDGERKQSVARFIERLGFTAVILHEQANAGATVIEKLEAHANAGFAVILWTGDDVGRFRDDAEDKPRARQNVIFECGYFMGKLGRERVCTLVERGVDIPSDLAGFGYVELDDRDRWHLDLAKELRSAGYTVDMNRL